MKMEDDKKTQNAGALAEPVLALYYTVVWERHDSFKLSV